MVFGKGVAGDKSLKPNPHCCVWGVEDGGGGGVYSPQDTQVKQRV